MCHFTLKAECNNFLVSLLIFTFGWCGPFQTHIFVIQEIFMCLWTRFLAGFHALLSLSFPCSEQWSISRHCSAGSNQATQIYIWPPALQFFSLFRVLIIAPMLVIRKIRPFSTATACTLFLHVYSSRINFIDILPPNNTLNYSNAAVRIVG